MTLEAGGVVKIKELYKHGFMTAKLFPTGFEE